MLFAFLAIFQPAGAMECGTSEALDALMGRAPARLSAMVERPSFIHAPMHPPPPDRTIYGTPWDDHVETSHFTIQWWSSAVDEQQVQKTAEALELGWRSFVSEQGWTQPVSSDQYYIWVLLDPDLGSTTGYTTEYYDSNYPDGFPVIYVNPTTLYDFGEPFYTSLVVHELMHAIQYGMRDYAWEDENSDVENWYWEASATHASELADPSVDGHQYTSAWYAEQPHLRYDSYEGAHQYGMFVLNAWLEEHHGPGTMQAVWRAGETRNGAPWPDIIEAATGEAPAQTWSGFTQAYGNGTMGESRLYTDVAIEGALEDGSSGRLDELGTHYWTVGEDVVVTPDSDAVILGGASAPGEAVRTHTTRRLSVTALQNGTSYALTLSEPTEPEDTGSPVDPDDDSDSDDSDAGSGGDSDSPTDDAEASTGDSTASKSEGCSTAPATPWRSGVGLLALVVLGVLRRRRS